MPMTRAQAWDLLTQYNKGEFLLRHAITLEHVMGWYARELGYGDQAEHWSIVGLLHDLDYEKYPEEHCTKVRQILGEKGVDEGVIRAVASHGWGMCSELEPQTEME